MTGGGGSRRCYRTAAEPPRLMPCSASPITGVSGAFSTSLTFGLYPCAPGTPRTCARALSPSPQRRGNELPRDACYWCWTIASCNQMLVKAGIHGAVKRSRHRIRLGRPPSSCGPAPVSCGAQRIRRRCPDGCPDARARRIEAPRARSAHRRCAGPADHCPVTAGRWRSEPAACAAVAGVTSHLQAVRFRWWCGKLRKRINRVFEKKPAPSPLALPVPPPRRRQAYLIPYGCPSWA